MPPTPNKYATFHLWILDKVLFSWYGRVGILCLLSGIVFFGKDHIKWTILEGDMRAFLLVFWGVAIFLTICGIVELRFVLKYRPTWVVDLKLAAEISAGVGIFAFVAQFAQIGSTLDHLSPTDRSKQLQVISADMRIVLKCAQIPPPNPEACAEARDNLLRLEMYIATRSEHDVESVSNELKAQVQHLKNPAKELDAIRTRLNGMSRIDDAVPWILLFMPILTLVFASFAIAAKIALAVHDKYKPVQVKEPDVAPPSPPAAEIPVSPQADNPAVVAVAVAVTAVAAAVIVSEAAQVISDLRRSD